jgi:LysR family transcriptional regulator, benzoate and cis,cis-muconate-responsive activator of ben and cat genes
MRSAGSDGAAPHSVELRHLRYFVAVAEAGTFTHAAERMFIAQPTLSQQIRRLEGMVGAPLLQRRREGVRLTEAGTVLLEESRAVLAMIDQGVSRTRQAAGLGRPRLRFAVSPYLPESLAVEAASQLLATAATAGVELAWLEMSLDAEFSAVRQRRADAGLGWLTVPVKALPVPLDVMGLGEFEPDVWLPCTIPGATPQVIGLDELAHMDVIHGPRRLSSGLYDSWLEVLRARNPRFDFTDPPFRHSLPMTLAFAATATRPTAVLTSPRLRAGAWRPPAQPIPATGTYDLVPARVEHRTLTATAALAWSGDLPRQLQQLLFDIADSIAL